MNRYLLLLIFLFFLGTSLSAQTQTVSIETVSSCAGQEVFLNVTASNLLNVVAITLYLDINTDSLTFISLTNIDPQLEGLLYNYIPDSNRLYVGWNKLVPVNFNQKKLFEIKCGVVETPSNISFSTSCEIIDSSLTPIAVTYLRGIVTSAIPDIISQPVAQTLSAGGTASFQVISENTDGYQWEERSAGSSLWTRLSDEGNYSGVHTNRLTIVNVPIAFDNNVYHCVLRNEACSATSVQAPLRVDSTTSVNSLQETKNFTITNCPNPFHESTVIKYYLPEDGNISIRIYSIVGSMVADLVNSDMNRGRHEVTFFTNGLNSGVYLCRIEYITRNERFVSTKKIIKN